MSLSLSRKRRLREEEAAATSSEVTSTSPVTDENDPPTQNIKRKRAKGPSQCLLQTSQQSSHLFRSSTSPELSRCGKILRMHLTNFMCHSNLSMELHQRINFLVGANGSGKSSIMAALVVGLGSKAKDTNRSSSLKQLIKHGETSAKVEITLVNDGPGSYEHETYGDSITITRTINQGGGSVYTIKDENGYIVSKRVDDLHRILMYHNVQVDNPVFVLNQDNAREFLKDLDPVKNYKLFLKATQIETITEKLNECLHQHRDHQVHLHCKKKKMKLMEDEVKTLELRLETLNEFASLKDKLKHSENEILWLLVSQIEDELEEHQAKINEILAQKEKLCGLVTNKTETENRVKVEIRNLEQIIAEKGENQSTEHENLQALKTKLMQLNVQRSNISAEIVSLRQKAKYLQDQMADLNAHIDKNSQTTEADINALRESNEARIEDLKKQCEENKAMQDATKRDISLFNNNKQKNQEQAELLKRKKVAMAQNVERLNHQVASLGRSANSGFSVYGEEMVRLIAEIEKLNRLGKFSAMPRGPVGSFIKVPNGKFRDTVEHVLGRMAQAFIVNTNADRILLEGLIKRFCTRNRPTIITTKFQHTIYNVKAGSVYPVPQGTHLLLNLINCSEPVVMNYLIDAFKIEKVLIADNKDAAKDCTAYAENKPKNLQKVIVPSNPGLEYFPAPNYRVYTIDIKRAQFLQIDVKHHIENLQREKADLVQKISEVEDQIIGLQGEIEKDVKRFCEKRLILNKHAAKQRELEEKITELEEFEYPDSSQVELLNREIAEVEGKIKGNQEKLDTKLTEQKSFETRKNKLSEEILQQEIIIKNIEEEINAENRKINDRRMILLSLNDSFRQNQRKLDGVNEKLKDLERTKEQKQQLCNINLRKAQNNGDRFVTNRTEDEIKQEINEIKIKLNEGEQISDTPEDLLSMIRAKQEIVNDEKMVYDKLKASLTMLGNSLRTRFSFMKKLKQHMVLILQYSFDFVLKARDFLGSVEVNHTEKTLKLSVIPRDKHLAGAVSSTRALSGGERSYSTVAFLIALWSCVDHPFYFLDEYDVFTDVVNRDALTSLLINEGKSRPNRQYTFLTPQDMALNANNITKIHRFKEPERR